MEIPNVYRLARMADCADPDSPTSPGGKFLRGCADDIAEAMEWQRDNGGTDDISDIIHERADSMVPIPTHELWAVFVDLGAYGQDIGEYGPITDLENGAQVALYMIAETLMSALVEQWGLETS